jgi:hypothetical protein
MAVTHALPGPPARNSRGLARSGQSQFDQRRKIMHPRTLFTVAAAALVMLVSQPAHAQVQYDFKVPFDFVAHGKAFKAGDYVMVPNSEDNVFTLEAKDSKGGEVILPVEARISGNPSAADPLVVFDKLDGKYYVSELEVVGNDGYLFLATKAKHTHESVKGSRRRG